MINKTPNNCRTQTKKQNQQSKYVAVRITMNI